MNKSIAISLITIAILGIVFLLAVLILLVRPGPQAEEPREIIEKTEEVIAKRSAQFTAVGDIMLGRHVETLMNRNGEDYPFELIDDFLQQSDLVAANFEGTIVEPHVQTPLASFQFSFPTSSAQVLKRHNIDLVSLANNHGYDYGKAGYESTQYFLGQADVSHFGSAAGIVPKSSLWFSFHDVPLVWIGINATFPSFDLQKTVALVKENKIAHASSTIIIQIHWGNEYELVSSAQQQNIAHALIDAGTDIIIGHHPHVVQNIEKYKNKLIFYSLGNFIFDQYFSKDVQEGLAVSFTIRESLTKEGLSKEMEVELVPLSSAQSQPRLMPDDQKTAWFKALAERSSQDLYEEIIRGVINLKN